MLWMLPRTRRCRTQLLPHRRKLCRFLLLPFLGFLRVLLPFERRKRVNLRLATILSILFIFNDDAEWRIVGQLLLLLLLSLLLLRLCQRGLRQIPGLLRFPLSGSLSF